MKNKKILITFFAILFVFTILPTTVFAKNITSINLAQNNQKITVSGEVENGVLAVAIVVYQNNNLNYMETCNVNNDNTYSCLLNHTFTEGTYTVKIADYNGGNYISKDIKILSQKNPKTFDGVLIYAGLGLISLLGIVGITLYLRKNTIKNHINN